MALRLRRDGDVTLLGRHRGSRGWRSATLGVVAVAVLLPLATFLVAAWLLGWQLQSVRSGSMVPTYPVGSLVVVGQIDAAAVAPGMAIVFEDPAEAGRLVTHRVIGLAPSPELQFVTRGDANAAVDAAPVPARLVRGRVLWSVTHFGSLIEWLQWPRSFVAFVLLPASLLAALELRGRRTRGNELADARNQASARWSMSKWSRRYRP
jgi:signal peptidase